MRLRGALSFILIASLVACADDDTSPTPEQVEEREIASRQACIAERLAQEAREELRMLEEMTAISGPVAFQQAFTHHANLRLAALAKLDTALNHTRTPDDSTRYAAAARNYQIRAPDPESVEANVIRSYEAKFAAILNDPDDPCNWQSELEQVD